MVVITGTVNNGDIVPIPEGFTQEQCKFILVPQVWYTFAETDNTDKIWNNTVCSVDPITRVATIISSSKFAGPKAGIATYIVIGTR